MACLRSCALQLQSAVGPTRGWLSLSSSIVGSQNRTFSTAKLETCTLSFDHVPAQGDGAVKDQSLVICHGLFGSKQNWRSLSRAFASKLGMDVYTLDLRNHGHSPHKRPMDYAHMAADVSRFLQENGLERGVNLMGHSMGGKVVMALALNKELNGPLRTLISADMAPGRGKVSPEFQMYTDAMKEVEDAKVTSKHEGDKILEKYEKESPTRQFLLTNAMTNADKTLSFRIPLDILSESIQHIGDFPYAPGEVSWEGPTLFVKGKRSKYLNRRNLPDCEAFFPKMKLEILDTGHWVHAERPGEFVDVVSGFVKGAGRE